MLVQVYEITSPDEARALAQLGEDHIGVLVGDGSFPREQPNNLLCERKRYERREGWSNHIEVPDGLSDPFVIRPSNTLQCHVPILRMCHGLMNRLAMAHQVLLRSDELL